MGGPFSTEDDSSKRPPPSTDPRRKQTLLSLLSALTELSQFDDVGGLGALTSVSYVYIPLNDFLIDFNQRTNTNHAEGAGDRDVRE